MQRRIAVLLAVAFLALVGGSSTAAALPVPGSATVPHVYLIMGENTELTQVNKNNAPYLLNTLKPEGTWLTNYFALTHFSEANYVGMMAGQFDKCQQFDGSAASCHRPWDNLFHQMDGAGVTWQSWMESMPSRCALTSSGAPKTLDHYGAKHNPAIFFDNIEGTFDGTQYVWSATNPSQECVNDDLPAGQIKPVVGNDMSVFNSASHADFNLVVPNECEDAHDNCPPPKTSVLQFDAFLRNEVPVIQASDPGALIIITFDEGTSNKGPSNSKQFAGGGNVVFLAIGPGVTTNHDEVTPSNHYGLLKTLEACYGLPDLSGASGGYNAAEPISGICQ
jgi:hypothetical protein